MRVLAISGSLQAASSNTALLHVAEEVAPEGVEVVRYPSVADLPYFSPDLDVDPAPPAVTAFRNLLGAADAVVIASPEYAHSLPGSLKNALDWIVSSGELYEKPVAILCGSPRGDGGVRGRDALERTLRAQGSRVVVSRTIAIKRSEGVGTPQIAAAVAAALGELDEGAA